MYTIVKIEDINGEPRVIQDLPGSLRLGDPLRLRFRLVRTSHGRYEVLEVDHVFRVTASALDASRTPHRQLLSLESASGRPPVWKSVKRPSEPSRKLPPAVFPKTPI